MGTGSFIQKTLTPEQMKQLIENDPDFIASKRYNYSLKMLLERYPEGCPDRIVASALQLEEEEIDAIYQEIVKKLRKAMKVNDSL